MKKYMNITEFAKFSKTSRQTLIYYDRINLFKPELYGSNGYRKYSHHQIAELTTIRTLQDLGSSLEEIKNFLTDRSARQSISVLESLNNRVQDKIKDLNSIQLSIQSRILKEKYLERIETDQMNTIDISNSYFYYEDFNTEMYSSYDMFKDYYDIYFMTNIESQMENHDMLNGEPWGFLIERNDGYSYKLKILKVLKQYPSYVGNKNISNKINFVQKHLSIHTFYNFNDISKSLDTMDEYYSKNNIKKFNTFIILFWDDEISENNLENQRVEILAKL